MLAVGLESAAGVSSPGYLEVYCTDIHVYTHSAAAFIAQWLSIHLKSRGYRDQTFLTFVKWKRGTTWSEIEVRSEWERGTVLFEKEVVQ